MTILSVPNLGKILKNDNSEFFSVPGNISNYYNSEFFNRGNISNIYNSEFSICGNNDNININSVSQNLNNKFDVSPSSIGRLNFINYNSEFSNCGNISNNYNSEFFQSWQHLISCLRAQPSSCPVVAPLISGALSFTANSLFIQSSSIQS